MAWIALVRPGSLDLPFWWDEADVYVPGAWWVAEHDLVLTPGVFPDDYSRGHPPGLYAIAALAFRAFGGTPLVAHCLVLPFTVAGLAFTYLLGTRLFGRRAGAGAALLMATTPLYMSIGNMLLPEVPLTTLAIASLLALAHERVFLASALGVAAITLKETGIFMPAAIGLALLWRAYSQGGLRRLKERQTVIELGAATLPLIALVAFFVWQRVNAGYFVFPHHANLFSAGDYEPFRAIPSMLIWNGRWVAVLFALAAAALARTRWPRAHPTRRIVVLAIVGATLINMVFFGQMFWLERYALPAHPGIVVLISGALLAGAGSISRSHAALRSAPLIAAATLGASAFWSPTAPDEEELTFVYADTIATHQAAFADIVERGDPLVLTPWPMQVELRDPRLGYVTEPIRTEHPRSAQSAHHDVILFGTHSSRAEELRARARAQGMHLSATHRIGEASPLELWAHD